MILTKIYINKEVFLMDNEHIISVIDYWIDWKERMAYCIGEIDGILYFSESYITALPKLEKGQDENGERK